MRLGIFGGSFDPVHFGHLRLAVCCRDQCALDRVWFLPAAVPPHKLEGPRTGDGERVDMLELALAEYEGFEVCRLELERGGVSYTVDTLTEIAAAEPEAELFLLLGADSLIDLPHWYRTEDICRLATPLVVGRPDTPPPDYERLADVLSSERIEAIRRHRVEMPPVAASSTEIRRRIAAGEPIDDLTPAAVARYICGNGLYCTG